jgi:hypothetical protein
MRKLTNGMDALFSEPTSAEINACLALQIPGLLRESRKG